MNYEAEDTYLQIINFCEKSKIEDWLRIVAICYTNLGKLAISKKKYNQVKETNTLIKFNQIDFF